MYRKIVSFKESINAWQNKIQYSIRIPFPFSWLCLSAILFGIGFFVIAIYEPDYTSIRLIGIGTLIIAVTANAVVFYENIINEISDTLPNFIIAKDEQVKEWLLTWYNIIFWSKYNINVGIMNGVIFSIAGSIIASNFFSSIPGILLGIVLFFLIGFFIGSMFWVMIGIARLFSSLGRDIAIRQSAFYISSNLPRTATIALLKICIITIFVFIIFISIYFFYAETKSSFFLTISVGFGMFLIIYYTVPQIGIRKALSYYKMAKLRALEVQIDNSFGKVAANPSQDNIKQLHDLFKLQKVVNGKNSWSFGTRELLILMGSVIIPLIILLIDFFKNS